MKVHIVQVNESLKDIARKYDLPVEDVIKNNLHISNVKHILPGMKLRLPILAEEAEEKLHENTINIQEYYPTLEDFIKHEESKVLDDHDNEIEFEEFEEVEEDVVEEDVNQSDQQPEPQQQPQPSQPQPQQQNPYYGSIQQPYYQQAYNQQPQPQYPYQQPYYQQPMNPYPYNPYQSMPVYRHEEERPAKPITIDLRKSKK
jgi:LysM repeat protein